jgi:single-strand DNA-binding protein
VANFNQVILIGNLTRDPQLKYLPSQMAVTEFGLAINHKYRTKDGEDREEVTFVDITAFGKQAEIVNEHCRKGKALMVCGRLKYDTWEDKQSGAKRSKLSVVLEQFQFIGPKEDGGGGEQQAPRARNTLGQPGPSSDAYKTAKAGARMGLPDAPHTEQDDGDFFKDKDIPF